MNVRACATEENIAVVEALVAIKEQLQIGNRIAVAHLAHDAESGHTWGKVVDFGNNPERIFVVGDDELKTAILKPEIAEGIYG